MTIEYILIVGLVAALAKLHGGFRGNKGRAPSKADRRESVDPSYPDMLPFPTLSPVDQAIKDRYGV